MNEKEKLQKEFDELIKKNLTSTTSKSTLNSTSRKTASDILKTGIARSTSNMSSKEGRNVLSTAGYSLASVPPTITDAGFIALGNELDNRDKGLITFREFINNAKNDKGSTWQKIVNRIGDASELAKRLLPYAEAIDATSDKIAQKTISNIAQKSGKSEDEVVKEIITKGLSLGDKLDTKLYSLSQEREGMSSTAQTAGQVAEALGNMLPAVAVGILTKKPDIAMLMLSGSAMGSKGQEVYRKTGDIGKAYDAGVTEGVKEYATERMFGGVAGLGKGLVPASISKSLTQNAATAVKGFLNTPAGQIAKYLANAGGEGVEELVSQGLEVYVDRTYDPEAAKATKEELFEAAKIGGIVSLILGVGNINTNVTPVKPVETPIEQPFEQPIEQSIKQPAQPELPTEQQGNIDMSVPEGTGKVVPSEFGTNTIPKMVESGTLSAAIKAEMTKPEHSMVSDAQLINTAKSIINTYTADGVNQYLSDKMNGRQPLNSVETTAVNELIQEYSKTGLDADKTKAVNLVNLFTSTASDMGRALRAIRLFQQAMPGGLVRLANTQLVAKGLPELTPQEVADMNALQELANQADRLIALDPITRKAEVNKLTQGMSEDYKKYVNRVFKKKDLSEAKDWFTMLTQKITSDKANVTSVDKFRALQRINLLLNPKTQVRNLLGNTAHSAMELTSNALVAPWVDKLMKLSTGQRTATTPQMGKYFGGMGKGASDTITAAMTGTLTQLGNKYTDGTKMPSKSFTGNNPLSAIGRGVDTATTFALTFGDKIFSEARYADVEAQLKKINPNLSEEQIKEIAEEVSSTATFQNKSKIADIALGLRGLADKIGEKGTVGNAAANIISYATMPFAKTPANILAQVLNYSPAGLLKGVFYDAVKVARKGTNATPIEQRRAVDAISRGVVGSGIMGVGVLLASLGLASGSVDDKKEKEYRKMNGISDNSFKIGDYWFDFSSIGPLPAAINLGASVYNELTGEGWDKRSALSVVQTLLSAPIQDVTQDSLWQGIIRLSENISNNDINGVITDVLSNTAIQMVPLGSFLRAVAGATDEYTRETSSDKEFGWTWNRIKAQVPGLSETLPIKYNEAGEPVERYPSAENTAGKAAMSALMPALVSKDKSNDPVVKELSRLYNITGEDTSLQNAPYSFTKDGEDIILRGEDRSEYQRILGNTSKRALQELINSKQYKQALAVDKVKLINAAMSLGTDAAKLDYFNGGYEPSSIYNFTLAAKQRGISVGNSILAYKFNSTATTNKDANGKTINGSKKEKVWNYLDELNLSREQKLWMMEQFDYSTKGL
ncbi:MAG: hypothetical protein ACOX8A_08280 [Thermacetogeniaceae bacterium]|jgi:hypothetical protein